MISRRECLALFAAPVVPPVGIDGTVGVATLDLTTNVRESLNGKERFPLGSVFKLPVALHVLALSDEGKFGLRDEVEVLERDVRPWMSSVADRWPGEKRFAIDELLSRMVAQSDNSAVDVLLRICGGPAAVTARLREWGIGGIRVDRGEGRLLLDSLGIPDAPREEHWTPTMFKRMFSYPETRVALERFMADPRDTGTPDATVNLLARLYRGELLSKSATAKIIGILESTTSCPGRLKGLLPQGTVVAHKSGTGFTTDGLNSATNDVGVIGNRLAIAVYIKGSTRPGAAREKAIAEIARDAWSKRQ